MVAWRGRGWLFGGRTQQHVCSNQLYLFEPGYYSHLPDRFIAGSSENGKNRATTVIDIVQPCWAEVVGTTGASPSPRDGHAATVLENAMFIFGGFQDVVSVVHPPLSSVCCFRLVELSTMITTYVCMPRLINNTQRYENILRKQDQFFSFCRSPRIRNRCFYPTIHLCAFLLLRQYTFVVCL